MANPEVLSEPSMALIQWEMWIGAAAWSLRSISGAAHSEDCCESRYQRSNESFPGSGVV